ncbi:MAG: Glu/Leu/Phe/Val dehydrogenase dimerization domain-containing protein, partial [Nitrospinota bacterium]|nr:Glu/Leu/Phe/Val dehydrogenase dimerization domain-containing protein [Nitrospinota bacterium]
QLSERELERLTRKFIERIGFAFGLHLDIPAPDVNTNAQVMAWIMDTYSILRGHTVHGAVTGKPLLLGGSHMRREATGRGAVCVFGRACRAWGWDPAGLTAVIQGFGNVGSVTAKLLDEIGCRIIGVSDGEGGVHNPSGLDMEAVFEYKDGPGGQSVNGFPEADAVASDEVLYLDADIVIPAAIENQIRADNVDRIRPRLLIEAANGPTTPERTRRFSTGGSSSCPTSSPTPAASSSLIWSGFRTSRNSGGRRNPSTTSSGARWKRAFTRSTRSPIGRRPTCGRLVTASP